MMSSLGLGEVLQFLGQVKFLCFLVSNKRSSMQAGLLQSLKLWDFTFGITDHAEMDICV